MVDRHITRDSSNEGYIDFGIPPTNDTEIEIKYKATNIEDKIIGSNKFNLHLYEYGSDDYLALSCGGGSLTMDNYIFGLYTLRLKNFSVRNVVADEIVKSGTQQDLSGDSSHIQLFNSGSQYGEVYYVKIWQNGELVVDAVPHQLEDGTGTLYDNVKGSAYAVNGGTFGYVETEANYNLRWYPSGTVCDNQGLYQRDVLQVTTNAGRTWGYMTPIETRKGALLCPSAIHCGGEASKIDFTKEVPFVRNLDQDGILTGVESTNDQVIQATFSVHEVSVNPYGATGRIVGSIGHHIGFNSAKKLYYQCKPSSAVTVDKVFDGFDVDEIYSLEFGNNYLKDLWSGEILYSGDTVDISNSGQIAMLGGNNSALLFNLKVWQGGSLVVDAVPCRYPLGYGTFVNCVDGNIFGVSDEYDQNFSYETMLLGEGVHVDIGSLCKFYKQQKYESTDGGKTWNPVEEYRKGELYEANSEDCFQDRWVERGELCIGYSAHTALVLQHSVDGSTWTDSDPLEMKVGENLGIDSNCINDYAGYCPECVDLYKRVSCYSETSKNGVLTSSKLYNGRTPGTSGYVGTCITSVEGDNAFYGESWAAVILPDTISAMTDNTMQSLYEVSSVTVDNQTPPQIGDLGLPESTIIIVPLGCAEKYGSAEGWDAFDGRIFEEVRGKEYVFKENGETLCKYNALFKKEPLYLVDGEGNEEQLDFYRMGALVSGYSEECGAQAQESEVPICKTPTPIDLGVRFTTNTQIIIKLSYSLDGDYETTILSDDERKTRLTWEGHNGASNEFFWIVDGLTSLRCTDYYQDTPSVLELGNRYVSRIMNDPTTQVVASDRKITTFESASTLKLFTSDDNADVCVYWIKVIQDGNLVLDAASNGKGQLYDYVGGKVLYDNGMGSCDYKFKYTLAGDGDVEHTVPYDGNTTISNGDMTDIIPNVTSLTIGNCITAIDTNFMGTSTIDSDNSGRLDKVFIPSSVTEIREGAFRQIDISDGITFEGATPPSLGYWGLGDNTIYVPCGCVEAYVNGPGYWSSIKKERILEYPDCNDTQNP